MDLTIFNVVIYCFIKNAEYCKNSKMNGDRESLKIFLGL